MKQLSPRPHPLEQRLAELRAEHPSPYPDYTELRTVIEQRPDRLRIEIPPAPSDLGASFLTFLFVGPWLAFEIGLAYLLTTVEPGERLYGALFLAVFGVLGAPLINHFCVPMFRREILTFENGAWTACTRILGWSRTQRFRLDELTAVRLLPKNPDSDAYRSHALELVQAGGSVRWGRGIQLREAQLVGELIEHWLRQTRATLR